MRKRNLCITLGFIFGGIIFPSDCFADAFRLLSTDMEVKKFFKNSVVPLISDNGLKSAPDVEIGLNNKIGIVDFLYWKNTIHGMTDKTLDGRSQFRAVGWKFEIGKSFGWFDVFYHHHSQHELDNRYPVGAWPREDAVGIRIYLYKEKGQ